MRYFQWFKGWSGAAVVLFLLPTAVFAKASDDTRLEFSGLQWIWALFSLVLVVFLAYWATRFLAGRMVESSARHLKVAESLFLGPNRQLYLLLVNGKVLLVGGSEHGLTLLREFDDAPFYEELLKSGANPPMPPNSFTQIITPFLNGLNAKETTQAVVMDGKEKLSKGLERIRAWKERGRGR